MESKTSRVGHLMDTGSKSAEAYLVKLYQAECLSMSKCLIKIYEIHRLSAVLTFRLIKSLLHKYMKTGS